MEDRIKVREIAFQVPHPDPDQARTALESVTAITGVQEAIHHGPQLLVVRYDIRYITLEELEGLCRELGLHLDNSLLYRLKRALYHYTEETQRANLAGCDKGQHNCTEHAFIITYQRHRHGCRDERPEYLRNYL
ncbi:hypothetical protein [Thiohalospira sp.]|uniref:hypothetical protein n=1 Tax=Thiohalospira sp. TaxID=3080549 RepID=UPI00397F0355